MVGGRKVGEGNRGTSPTVDPLEPFFLIGLTLCLHLEVPRAIKAVPNPTLSRGITMLRMVLPIDTIYQSYFWKSFFYSSSSTGGKGTSSVGSYSLSGKSSVALSG